MPLTKQIATVTGGSCICANCAQTGSGEKQHHMEDGFDRHCLNVFLTHPRGRGLVRQAAKPSSLPTVWEKGCSAWAPEQLRLFHFRILAGSARPNRLGDPLLDRR